MINRYGLYLPLPIVAALLAFVYGLSIRHAWISAILTFCIVLLGGWLYGAIGQIVCVAISALLIFFIFVLPEHRRQAHEEYRREQDMRNLPNEEDM